MDSFWVELFKFLGIVATVGIPNLVAYAKLQRKLDDQHTRVDEKLDHSISKNEMQIHASNNFNTKLEKLTATAQHQAHQLDRVGVKLDRLDRDIRTLSEGTGITIGN